MARYKHFLDIDVLQAARQRIAHVFDIFDVVVVMFSGGKDSLTVLLLVWEEARRRGLKSVHVVFRDEELLPDAVIDFVNSYRLADWVEMDWYAVPLRSQKFILGKSYEYLQWDPARKWVRPIPPWAIRLPAGDTRVFDQFTMDTLIASRFKGSVAFMTGIRAAESIMRYRGSVAKLNDNYITASSDARVKLCKPIYDWQEADVFKFFYDSGVRYCPIYDAQHLAGDRLRVATPLHAVGAKNIGVLRTIDPVFYQRVVDIFPEIIVQERYWSQLRRDNLDEEYAQDYEGVRRYLMENTDPKQLPHALYLLDKVLVTARKCPDAFPPRHLLRWAMRGVTNKPPLPLNKAGQAEAQRSDAQRKAAKT